MRIAVLLLAALAMRGEEIRGGAVRADGRIVTWGDRLLEWDVATGAKRVLVERGGYGRGGCVADVDGDGREEVIVQQRPGVSALVVLRGPGWAPEVVDGETEFGECVGFELGGRRGVLVPHLYAQLRFYEFPGFGVKELYSIYTPSRQGGLVVRDVDGDGVTDVFWGNYWVRNPGRLGEAWRLFAINTFHERPESAMAALAVTREGRLMWAEGESERARVVEFTPPGDVKQLWTERRLRPVGRPRALLVRGGELLIGHAGGVMLEELETGRRTEVARTPAVLRLFEIDGAVWAVTVRDVRRVYPRR